MSDPMNEVRNKLRVHHCALKTEKTYVQWIVRAKPQRRIPVVLSQQEVTPLFADNSGKSPGTVTVSQDVFLYLAHGVSRQFINQDHPAGLFEGGELQSRCFHYRCFAGCLVLASDHDCDHAFAEIGMRDADDRRL